MEDSLVIDELKLFRSRLSPAAAELFACPTGIVLPETPGRHLAYFAKEVQWPPKPWYEERLAEVVNDFVGAGLVQAVMAYGSFALATSYWTPMEESDMGPDRVGNLFVFFYSPLDRDQLNARFRTEAFRREGEVGRGNWHDFARRTAWTPPSASAAV